MYSVVQILCIIYFSNFYKDRGRFPVLTKEDKEPSPDCFFLSASALEETLPFNYTVEYGYSWAYEWDW